MPETGLRVKKRCIPELPLELHPADNKPVPWISFPGNAGSPHARTVDETQKGIDSEITISYHDFWSTLADYFKFGPESEQAHVRFMKMKVKYPPSLLAKCSLIASLLGPVLTALGLLCITLVSSLLRPAHQHLSWVATVFNYVAIPSLFLLPLLAFFLGVYDRAKRKQSSFNGVIRSSDLDQCGYVTMPDDIERNLGEQPIARIITEHHLTRHSLVEISTQHITHKMVTRACKGRRLTPNAKNKILDALNRATDRTYSIGELFNY